MHRPQVLAASFVLLAGCSEPPGDQCELGSVSVIELGPGELCGVTPTGLVLHREQSTGDLVLDRLAGDGTLAEFVRLEGAGWRCGVAVEDPTSGTIWVAVAVRSTDLHTQEPDHLYELDGAGTLRSIESLTVDEAPVQVSSLLVRAGDLFIGGRVHDEALEQVYGVAALLERRDGAGQTLWRQIGYQGLHPDTELSQWPLHGLGGLVLHTSGVAFLGARSGIDSSSIAMFSVRAGTGEAIWTEYVTPDNYDGPYPRLGSDGDRGLYIAEDRQPIWQFDFETLHITDVIRPARSVVTAYSYNGWTNWRAEAEWSDFNNIRVTEPVAKQHSVFNVVSGDDFFIPGRELGSGQRHVALARYDWTGAVDCRASLDHLGLESASSLSLVDDQQLVLGATVDSDELDPVIVVFNPAAEPLPPRPD